MKPNLLIANIVALAAVIGLFYVAYNDNSKSPHRRAPAPIINAYKQKPAQLPPAPAHNGYAQYVLPVEGEPSAPASNTNAQEPTPIDTTVYSPEYINAAFRDNEISAEAKFKGRTLIGGTATNIETNLVSGARLDLIGVSGESVLCDFDGNHAASLAALQRGTVVALSCERARRIMGGVIFGDCELVRVVQ